MNQTRQRVILSVDSNFESIEAFMGVGCKDWACFSQHQLLTSYLKQTLTRKQFSNHVTLFVIPIRDHYSAFANSCPLQIDTFRFPLIHSHNVLVSSNKFY